MEEKIENIPTLERLVIKYDLAQLSTEPSQ